MNITDFHIKFNLGVQEVASFQVDNILPQEVDHYLNAAMDRFIKQRYGARSNMKGLGFEQSQKRLDDLRSLVVDNEADTFFIGTGFSTTKKQFLVDRADLPLDYLFMVNIRANILYGCENVEIVNQVTPYKYGVINFNPPAAGYILTNIKADLYSGEEAFTILNNENGITENQLNNSQEYYAGRPIESIPNYSIGATSETSPTSESSILYIEFDAEAYTGDLDITHTWTHPINGDTITIIKPIVSAVNKIKRAPEKDLKEIKTVLKFAQHDDIYDMLIDPFNSTKPTYPVYTMQENFVDVFTDETFIVNSVNVKYIRNPKRMNKIEGVGCELPEHTHQEIVDMAIKNYLGDIENPRVDIQARRVLENE